MGDWSKIKWTEARQIAAAMDLDEAAHPPEGQDPRSFYVALREKGEIDRAVAYLGHALPRFEAVAWAAHALEARSRQKRLAPRDRQALDRTLRWLEEPTDEFRRAAYEAAQAAGRESPERMLGMAVFMSGGSMAPVNLPAVNPPQEVCGRVAAAAVLMAAHQSDNPAQALELALDTGDKVASKGVQALASP